MDLKTAMEDFIGDLTVNVMVDGYKVQTKPINVDMDKGEITIELDFGIKDMITYMPFKYDEKKHGFLFTTAEVEAFDDLPF